MFKDENETKVRKQISNKTFPLNAITLVKCCKLFKVFIRVFFFLERLFKCGFFVLSETARGMRMWVCRMFIQRLLFF